MSVIRWSACCVLLVWSSAVVPLAGQRTVVRVAVAPSGEEAWLSAATGLLVTGWSAAPSGQLQLGDGAFPRFDAAGNLYFVRGVEDGHRLLGTTSWWVPRGSTQPKPLADMAVMPPYALPPSTRRAGAAVPVCIDPGHGGSDPGAIGFGYQEKDINLDVGLKLRAWLDRDTQDATGGGDWNVLMTRTDDRFISLCQRANMANAFGAASFLSIHMNAFTSSAANGTETFCMVGQEANAGGRLRNVVQTEALAAWRLTNRGTKSANFAVLRLTAMPAALLEGGFMTSPIDIVPISDPAARDTLALHCLFALQQHHGFGRHRPSGGSVNGTLKGVLYDAARGTAARIGGGMVGLGDGRFTMARASDGYFEMTLPAATYSYAATAAGFDPLAASRTVPAGGEIWGSLGLSPANVPALALDPNPPPSAPLNLSVRGDPGSPVVLFVNTTVGLPLLSWSALGLGTSWPSLAGAASATIGVVPAGGTLALALRAPAQVGFRVHCQAAVRSGGGFRLTNGAAFEVR